MITSRAWAGKRYAVLGLARSGAATVNALLASGASVVAWDSNEDAREAVVDAVQELSLELDEVSLGIVDPITLDLKNFDAVLASPGIPLNRHPISAAAAGAGVPIIGDIELFAQARASLPPHKVVGITGTNGKSTTTALVHHILRTAGVPTTMGGNIGLPILAQDPLPEGGVYVLELSSYQIDLTQSLDCDVAVLLNITPDHLDRYESLEAYRQSKLRLFGMQAKRHAAVFDFDDIATDDLKDRPGGHWFTGDLVGHSTNWRNWPTLQGPHNRQNAAACIMTCNALGIGSDAIAIGLCTFTGLPHRMERIADRSGVFFVNDSKATNPASAAPALAAFDAVHWILGGRAKSDDLDACVPHFGHVRAAYAIGEAGARFAAILRPHMPVADCGTLERAVGEAAAAARPGEVVLLSPAAASFDQFSDFEARGDAFRAYVEALA